MKLFKALMGLLFLGTMASSQAVILDTCSWDNPGVNPYKGAVSNAIDHYRDLSPELRAKFKQRLEKKQFDEVVTITKDRITGIHAYESTITDMHFGGKSAKPQICLATTRDKWSPTRKEEALVYCEGETCILVPTICQNISRVKRLPETQVTTGSHKGGGETAEVAQAQAEQPAEPTEGGGGGGGGGASNVAPGSITTGSGEPNNSLVNPGGNGWHGFTPWSPIDNGGGGGGGCCIVITPPIVPPIVTPPITTPVPEPESWVMFLTGVALMLLFSAIKKPRK
jgi:hypothetical protein